MRIPAKVRYFNKRVINRLTIKIAHLSWGPFCIISHGGRRTGRSYETPIMAFPMDEGFVIAMTYGPDTDWYRNIRRSGNCIIHWHRKIYKINKIELLDVKIARTYLPGLVKTALQVAGVQDFVKLVSLPEITDLN
ncbi:MAG: nitroreductase family deazaflavin-dependent oxidoreductase [Chloroflexi bacterium]|nr:nitroreductase family deazaflavin-dependent oxidoreductase [Chloroflexota bacterium]